MGIFDGLADKAKDLLDSDQGEQISDNVLGTVADKANDLTGGKFEGQINAGKDAADGAIGN